MGMIDKGSRQVQMGIAVAGSEILGQKVSHNKQYYKHGLSGLAEERPRKKKRCKIKK